MISKITSILTVGVAALLLAAPASQAAKSKKANIAALKSQLNKQPLHKGNVAKISSLVTQLVTADPKNGASYLKTGLTKLPIVNAKKNATALTNKAVSIVNKDKKLTKKQKTPITTKMKNSLKTYKPPGPTNPPYQAALGFHEVVA